MKPNAKDVLQELLVSVHRDIDDSWRHGNYVYEVFHRESDDTFWSTTYEESGDGEYNTLRDDPDSLEFTQVVPIAVVKTTVEYRPLEA